MVELIARGLQACLVGIICVNVAAAWAQQADEVVGPTTCVVNLTAPPGTKISIDGRDKDQLRYEYNSLQPGKHYSVRAHIIFPSGKEYSRRILLEGGKQLSIVLFEPGKSITNSIGMKLVLVPAGDFIMGRVEDKSSLVRAYGWAEDAFDGRDEQPAHSVRLTQPYFLGTHEVTVGQFRQFVEDTSYVTDTEKDVDGTKLFIDGNGKFEKTKNLSWKNPGYETDDTHPVVHVSWGDARSFCDWLSKKEDETYEFPTEAEWEYACRAGTETRYFNSDDPERLVDVASCRDATLKGRFRDWNNTLRGSDGFVYTSPVGSFKPNAFGLYDMHGNVWEMCADWYSKRTYERGAGRISVDPRGESGGLQHVNRGGCFYCMPLYLRSATRSGAPEDFGAINKGFRVVKRVKPE